MVRVKVHYCLSVPRFISQSVCHNLRLGFTVLGHSVQPLPNNFGLSFLYIYMYHLNACNCGLSITLLSEYYYCLMYRGT